MSAPDSVSTPAARPRWYQFRLRTLLAAVTLIAAGLWAFRIYVEPYRAQRQTMELIRELGGRYVATDPAPWQRRLLGGDQQNITLVDLADCDEPEKYLAHIARLPRLETLVVGGEAFGDEQLQRLAGLSRLRGLVLDSTSVSQTAIAAWRDRFPKTEVHRSERRASESLETNVVLDHLITHEESTLPPLSALVGREHFREVIGASFGRKPLEKKPVRRSANAPAEQQESRTTAPASPHEPYESGLALLAKFPKVETLELVGPDVCDATLSFLDRFSHLTELHLRATAITDGGLAKLQALPELKLLDLKRNEIGDAGLASLKYLKTLESLDLDDTRVTDGGIEHIINCIRLVSLRFARTRITAAGVSGLTGLRKLESLSIDGADIDDTVVTHLGALTNLKRLDLDNTRVSDLALVELTKIRGLQHLYVRGTKMTLGAMSRFRKAMPECKVFGP